MLFRFNHVISDHAPFFHNWGQRNFENVSYLFYLKRENTSYITIIIHLSIIYNFLFLHECQIINVPAHMWHAHFYSKFALFCLCLFLLNITARKKNLKQSYHIWNEKYGVCTFRWYMITVKNVAYSIKSFVYYATPLFSIKSYLRILCSC